MSTNSKEKNKFGTASRLSAYAFICGYLEKRERNGIEFTISMEHGTYDIKALQLKDYMCLEWRGCSTLKEARKIRSEMMKRLAPKKPKGFVIKKEQDVSDALEQIFFCGKKVIDWDARVVSIDRHRFTVKAKDGNGKVAIFSIECGYEGEAVNEVKDDFSVVE